MIQPDGGPGGSSSGGIERRPSSQRLPVNPRRHKVAPEQRKRVATACNNCNVRRVKCSGERPCRQCAATSRECVYPVSTDKVTVSRPELDELRRKVETYERALHDAVPDASRLQELLHLHQQQHQLLQGSPGSSSTSPPSSLPASTPASVACGSSTSTFEIEVETEATATPLAPTAVDGRLLRDADGTARYFGGTSSAAFLDHLRDFLSTVAPLAVGRQLAIGENRGNVDPDAEAIDAESNSAISSFLQTRGTYQTPGPLKEPDDVNPLWLPPSTTLGTMMLELRYVVQDGNGEWPSGGIHWFGNLAAVPSTAPPSSGPGSSNALRALALTHAAIALIAQTAKQPPPQGSPASAEAFFTRARRLMGGDPLDTSRCRTMSEVATLLLMGQYLIQANRREMAAAYMAAAVRAAVSLGAHRGWVDESGKRIFWTAYSLDRWMSCLLGRTPAITDEMIQLPPPQDSPGLPSSAGLRAHAELARIAGIINAASHRTVSPEESARILERTTWMLERWLARLPPALQLATGIGRDSACCLLHMQHNYLVILATRPVFFSAVRRTFAERLVTGRQPAIETHQQLRYLQSCAGAAQRILQLARAGLQQPQQQQQQAARKSISTILLHGSLQFILDAGMCLLLQELVTEDDTPDAELPSRNGAVDFALATFQDEGGDFAHESATTLHQLRVLVGRLREPMEGSFLAGSGAGVKTVGLDDNGKGDGNQIPVLDTTALQMQMLEGAGNRFDDLVEWMQGSQWLPSLDFSSTDQD